MKGRPQIRLIGFSSPTRFANALFTHMGGNMSLSFDSHTQAGALVEASSQAVPFEPPNPDWITRIRLPDASPEALWNAFEKARPAQGLLPVDPESLRRSSEHDWFRYQSWMAGRGGRTRWQQP